jgi:hypothetical protein
MENKMPIGFGIREITDSEKKTGHFRARGGVYDQGFGLFGHFHSDLLRPV